jgi:7,8-dihydro-6-hydroxymethylpterin dimethyltransferase
VLREDGVLIPTTQFGQTHGSIRPALRESFEQARDYVRRRWRYCDPIAPEQSNVCGSPDNLIERAQSHFLCISGMAFQDAWNIDLERLRRCCIHVVKPDGKLVPFCAHYLTGSHGNKITGDRGSRSAGIPPNAASFSGPKDR